MIDTPDHEVGEEAAAYEPSPDDYFQAKQAGFSDPQAQFLLRRFGQPGPDPTTITLLLQIQARLDQQQETQTEILTRLTRLETQREADREQYERDRQADREQYERDRQADRERYERDRQADQERYERDREEYLRQFAELRQGQRDLDERLVKVETGLVELRVDVQHLRDQTLFENRVWRAVVGLAAAAGAVIGGILAFWK
jgi:hypothetical protein